jgi:hypothetical protein
MSIYEQAKNLATRKTAEIVDARGRSTQVEIRNEAHAVTVIAIAQRNGDTVR